MEKITGNESAYPVIVGENGVMSSGMTLRQYYAGLAMQGIVNRLVELDGKGMFDAMARDAVTATDALIEALNKAEHGK